MKRNDVMEKLECTKETVLNYLWGVEHKYNEKYVEHCNNIKNGIAVNASREKARMLSDMKTTIQLLIIDFENDF